jgi:transposase-like protein
MTQTKIAQSTDGCVSVSDLAREFGRDLQAFRHWLLRHEFCVGRRLATVVILTDAEATKARFLNTHGVLLEEVRR